MLNEILSYLMKDKSIMEVYTKVDNYLLKDNELVVDKEDGSYKIIVSDYNKETNGRLTIKLNDLRDVITANRLVVTIKGEINLVYSKCDEGKYTKSSCKDKEDTLYKEFGDYVVEKLLISEVGAQWIILQDTNSKEYLESPKKNIYPLEDGKKSVRELMKSLEDINKSMTKIMEIQERINSTLHGAYNHPDRVKKSVGESIKQVANKLIQGTVNDQKTLIGVDYSADGNDSSIVTLAGNVVVEIAGKIPLGVSLSHIVETAMTFECKVYLGRNKDNNIVIDVSKGRNSITRILSKEDIQSCSSLVGLIDGVITGMCMTLRNKQENTTSWTPKLMSIVRKEALEKVNDCAFVVEPCVCDYAIYRQGVNGRREVITILNERSNANLVAKLMSDNYRTSRLINKIIECDNNNEKYGGVI